jgi:hypothetical protein
MSTQIGAGATRGPFLPRLGVHLLVGLGYSLLTFMLFAPALTDPAHQFIGVGGGDPLEKTWFLAWTPYAISHHQPILFSSAINHPAGINMMWNTSTLALGLVLSPVTALFTPVVAFNIGMTVAVIASAWCAYWAIGRLVPSRLGSILGGLMYGFSPYMMGQALGHLTLLFMVFPPIALVFFQEIVVLQRRRWWLLGALLGLAVAAQVFISEEVLTSTALCAAIALAVVAAFNRKQVKARLHYMLAAAVVAAGVAVLLSGWALLYQFTGPQQVHATLQGFGAFVTDPLGFFIPTANQLIGPRSLVDIARHFRGNPSEWNAYLGLPLIALLGWTVWRYRRTRFVLVVTVTAAIITLLSLGPYVVLRGHQFPIPLPWYVTRRIPILKDVLPNRLMAFSYLLVGLLLAHGISRLRGKPRRIRWGFAIAFAIAGVFLMPAVPRPATSVPPETNVAPQVASALRSGGVVLFSPYPTNNSDQSMLIQAENEFAFSIPGGYAYAPDLPPITAPTGLAVLGDPASIAARRAALANGAGRQRVFDQLRKGSVETIVVLAGPHASEFRSFWTALLGVPPAVYDGCALWTRVPTLTGA